MILRSVTAFGLVNVILYAAQFNIDLISLLLKSRPVFNRQSVIQHSPLQNCIVVEAQDTDGQAFVH